MRSKVVFESALSAYKGGLTLCPSPSDRPGKDAIVALITGRSSATMSGGGGDESGESRVEVREFRMRLCDVRCVVRD